MKVGPLSGVGHRFLDRKGSLEGFQLLTSMARISPEAKKRGSSLYWGWRKRILHMSQRSGEEGWGQRGKPPLLRPFLPPGLSLPTPEDSNPKRFLFSHPSGEGKQTLGCFRLL